MQQKLKLIVALLVSGLGTFYPAGISQAVQPARPGHFAELEELEAARKVGTLSAYDLFLARHPNSRYAEKAKSERSKLTKQ
jgi:hypothetical protein